MRICFIIPFMSGGGAERVIANLSEEMIRRGHNVSIMMTAGNDIAYSLSDSIEIIRLGDRTLGNPFKRFVRIAKMRRYYKGNRDVTYIGMETSTNIFAILASIGLRINLIVSERVDPGTYSAKWLRDIVYNLFGRKFVLQTKAAKDYFSKRIQRKTGIIPNPVCSALPPVFNGKRSNIIVAAGRLEDQKDYPILLNAFAILCNNNPTLDYKLHIYGKGSLEESLKNMADSLDISSKVVFKGFCSNIWDIENNASLYVLSSYYEGMPNSLIEAMAMGIPAISTDCPSGPSELIRNGENGLLVPVKDADALATAMEIVLSDAELSARLGNNARLIRQELSLDKICDEWLSVIGT